MPAPTISSLPPTPSRNAPSTFSDRMDAFLAAFPTFRTEVNALAAYLNQGLNVSPVVGNVSQSNGVPTGAVIESGRNASGRYVRWADGTQICTHKINLGSITAWGNGTLERPYKTSVFNWSYPAEFNDRGDPAIFHPIVQITPSWHPLIAASDGRVILANFGSVTKFAAHNIGGYRVGPATTSDTIQVNCMASGYWY